MLLSGCFRIYFLYDVADTLDLEKIRALLGPRAGSARQALPRRTPEYVRFESAPIIDPIGPVELAAGESAECFLKYYAFAAAVAQFDVPFQCDWSALVCQASHWMNAADLEPKARDIIRTRLSSIPSINVRPTNRWLQESYLITHIERILQDGSQEPAGPPDLLATHTREIAQLVRGESVPLASSVTHEILESSVSYYPEDLVVAGASGALVYDGSEDAVATLQVLEYAKMQLLEFRYYDGLMTRLLSDAYDSLETRRNVLLRRWSLPRDAERFNTIRLDVMELTERIDNAVKFVSDIYYARVYRLAASRIGLPEYRDLVDEKLRTMNELYEFMVAQFNEARSFVLEAAILTFALIDVILFIILLIRER